MTTPAIPDSNPVPTMPGRNGGRLRRGGTNPGAGRPRSEVVALVREKAWGVGVPQLAHLAKKAKDERIQLEASIALAKMATETPKQASVGQATQVNVGVPMQVMEPNDPVTPGEIRV